MGTHVSVHYKEFLYVFFISKSFTFFFFYSNNFSVYKSLNVMSQNLFPLGFSG